MHRTTVYLPDDLRERLARAARADHRKEADLIREGVERVLRERFTREDLPAPRVPLVDSGHPGLGLAADWLFADAPADILDWLVTDCRNVWAQQLAEDGPFFTFRLGFRAADDADRWVYDTGGPMRRMATQWSHICWSLELWRRMVMDGRPRAEGYEVLVLSRWNADQPPVAGDSPLEIATVEVGPRVGGPSASRR